MSAASLLEGWVEDAVRLVRAVLDEVNPHDPDRASLALSGASVALSDYIVLGSERGVEQEMVTQLRELHICLVGQVLDWDTRMQREDRSQRALGRSKKPVMVS